MEGPGEGPCHIKLYQALPKADKFDLIVRQAVELGVNEIVPVNLDHCVTKLSGSRLAKKLDRWQRLALAASKQAGRACVPQIGPLKSLSEVVREMEAADLAFVAYENEADYTLKDFCRAYWPQVKQGVCLESRKAQVAFLVGPEGGISRLEIDQLTEAEIPCVGLGPRILRTETCSAAILSMLLYEVEL